MNHCSFACLFMEINMKRIISTTIRFWLSCYQLDEKIGFLSYLISAELKTAKEAANMII